MDNTYYDPEDLNEKAQEEQEELENEGNAFAKTPEIRPLSKAIAENEEEEEKDR